MLGPAPVCETAWGGLGLTFPRPPITRSLPCQTLTGKFLRCFVPGLLQGLLLQPSVSPNLGMENTWQQLLRSRSPGATQPDLIWRKDNLAVEECDDPGGEFPL
ncbi:hypothetical protein NDU88_001867 [Pleurodeles waltl]|uniref:Uncharacterized protein n=1 Tax=Pleurodeles waltl TaxID=8319 RepID=A0AAV7KTS1_PLEWA|nr:hypothetical protein NDU88_001867 [Pleurodeles waltl]